MEEDENKTGCADPSDKSEKKACLVDEVEYKFCLPVLNDGKTESYVKLSKIMLIVQVTDNKYISCVKKLKAKYKQMCAVCPESNTSSLSLLNRNLKDCSETEKKRLLYVQVRQKCQSGINLVIINCSLNLADMRYFYDVARELGYIILFEPWKLDKDAMQQLQERTAATLLQGSLVNHVFFAWFLNEKDSLALRQECLMYIEDCVKEVKELKDMLKRCEALSDLPAYFQFGSRALEQDLVFSALRFCGSSYVSSDKAISMLMAKGVYGQVTKLKVFGFILSPFAIGAKVKLTFRQKELIDRHSNVDMCTYRDQRRMFCKRAQSKTTLSESQPCFSKCESTLVTFTDPQYDVEKPYTNRGQISILTLGYAKSKSPRDSARELSDAVSRELNVMTNDTDVESWCIRRSSVCRYGKYWMINLHDVLSVDAILSSDILVK